MRQQHFVALCCVAAVLAACGGAGGGGGSVPTMPIAPKPASGNVTLKIGIPAPPAHASARLLKHMNAAISTNGIIVSVYAHSDSAHSTLLATTGADISSGSSNCNPAGAGRNCTITFGSPPGSMDFVVRTYDQVPTGSNLATAQGNLLTAGQVSGQTVTTGSTTSASVTLGGVLASLAVVAPPILHELIPMSTTVSVYGRDAGGNTILGNYVDSSGNPLTVTLGFDYSGCAALLSLGTTSLTSSPAGGIPLTWNGGCVTNDQALNVTAGASGVPMANGPITIKYPTFVSHADSHINGLNTFSGMLYSGGDNQLFYSYSGSTTGVGVINLGSGVTNDYDAPDVGGGGIAQDSSSNVYMANSQEVDQFTPSAVPAPCATVCTGTGSGMSYDPSFQRLWYGLGTTLVSYDYINGIWSGYTPGLSIDSGIAVDSNAYVWIASQTGGPYLTYYDRSTFQQLALPNASSKPFDLAFDLGTSLLWATDPSGGFLYGIDTNTRTVKYQHKIPTGTIEYVTVDPLYPTIVYYTFTDNTDVGIGRYDASKDIMVNALDYNAPGTHPGKLAAIPSGNIFFINDSKSEVIEVTP